MRIYIEVLVVILLILVFIFGMMIKTMTKWWIKRRYKPENDRSKSGEEKRRTDIAAATEALGIRRLAKSPQQSDIPPTKVDDRREESISVGKTSKRIRNPFKTRK